MSPNDRSIEFEVTVKEAPLVKVEVDIKEIAIIVAGINPPVIDIHPVLQLEPVIVYVNLEATTPETLPNKFGIVTGRFHLIPAVQGRKTTFAKITFVVTNHISTGSQLGATKYGVVARPIIFGKAVTATKKTFGVVARPITFNSVISARKTAYGSMSLNITAQISINTSRGYGLGLYGKGLYSGGNYIDGTYATGSDGTGTYGGGTFGGIPSGSSSTAFSLNFNRSVVATKKTFGQVTFSIANNRVTNGTIGTVTHLYGINAYGVGPYGG